MASTESTTSTCSISCAISSEIEVDTGHNSSSEDGDISDVTTVPTLLDKLKSPKVSDLARKRKVRTNKPPIGRKRSKGAVASEPHTVSPSSRLSEYPDEPFRVTQGKHFCIACRETISVKKKCYFSTCKLY